MEIAVALNRRSVIGIRFHLDCDRRRARLRVLRDADNAGAAAGLLVSVVTALRIGGGISELVMRIAMFVVTDVKVIVKDLTYRAHVYVKAVHTDKLKTGQRRRRSNGDHLRAPTRPGPLPMNHRS